jgi:hypothetical protein
VVAVQGRSQPPRRRTAGAEGFTAGASPGGAANAVFVEDSCVMLIGDYKPQGELRGPVAHAVAAVYHRTHGTCPD